MSQHYRSSTLWLLAFDQEPQGPNGFVDSSSDTLVNGYTFQEGDGFGDGYFNDYLNGSGRGCYLHSKGDGSENGFYSS